jgi:hypothetical protein
VGCLEQNTLLFLSVGLLASCDLQMCTAAPVQLRFNCSWRYAPLLLNCICPTNKLDRAQFLKNECFLDYSAHFTFHWTQWYITMFTTVYHCILCWARLIQSTPAHPAPSKCI